MSAPAIGGKRLLLDSNLYVLLCVGMADLDYIGRHRRLGAYNRQDFELLNDLVGRADGLAIVPNVATEASNLTRQIADPARERIALVLRSLIEQAQEIYVASADAMNDPAYLRLGVADAALLHLLRIASDLILITADHDLHIAAALRHLPVVNFNHLRNI